MLVFSICFYLLVMLLSHCFQVVQLRRAVINCNNCQVVAGIEPIESLVKSLEGPEDRKDSRRSWKLADVFDNLPLSESSVPPPPPF